MPATSSFLLCLLFLFVLFVFSAAHSRWTCPVPRSSGTGLKKDPCGGVGDFTTNGQLTLSPGPNTLEFEESISHKGAPFRIALSQDGKDVYDCILLNHIPHNDAGRPTYLNEQTYVQYRITVDIPDVKCDNCALQLINPMTDKIGKGNSCVLGQSSSPNYCFSVYHSCANVKITGKIPRDNLNCTQPADWPYSNKQADMYTQESHPWQNGTLTGLPSQYSNKIGACYPGATVPAPTKVSDDVTATSDRNGDVVQEPIAKTLLALSTLITYLILT
ncbi:uncharacterized protein [Oscarella lobularis]|uniref:uncharacterized protein isoform X2 n=1 Tax=Oscarella lobularis TaxID=121494 RepID=UPI003313243C